MKLQLPKSPKGTVMALSGVGLVGLVGLVLVGVLAMVFGSEAVLGDLWGWPLNAAVWGTAGQWISSAVAAASLLVAVTIVLRDRRYRKTEDVEHAVAWVDDKDITFMNGNTLPVVAPVLYFIPKPQHAMKAAAQQLDAERQNDINSMKRNKPEMMAFIVAESGNESGAVQRKTFQNGESGTETWVFMPMHHKLYDWVLVFHDSRGQLWGREIPGKLLDHREVEAKLQKIATMNDEWNTSPERADLIAELKRDQTDDINAAGRCDDDIQK